jgi:hypothetical protein
MIHELVEGKRIDLGNFLLGPVIPDFSLDTTHGTGRLVVVEGIPFSGVVRETLGGAVGRRRIGYVTVEHDVIELLRDSRSECPSRSE